MKAYYPHFYPEEGSRLVVGDRVIEFKERSDPTSRYDTYLVEEDGEEKEMHIDEISALMQSEESIAFFRPGRL